MSFQTKTDAEKEARALCAEMGKGWKARVHQNLGWHTSILSPCGRYYVFRSRYGDYFTYHCLLGEPNSCAGIWTGTGRTGAEAVNKAREIALQQITAHAALLDMQLCDEEGIQVTQVQTNYKKASTLIKDSKKALNKALALLH